MRGYFAAVFLLFSCGVMAQTAFITGLKVKAEPHQCILTFSLNKKTAGRIKYLPAEQQVWVDFYNASATFAPPPLTYTNITAIEAKPNLNGIRYIIKIKIPITYEYRYLPKLNSIAYFEVKMSTPAIAHSPKSIFTVVVDAGHGGKDSGAVGARGLLEKQVVLGIAKQLAAHINATPGMKAILTRKGDYFVPLRQRLNMARRSKADLFIAIHADAHYDPKAEGVSVFALSKHGATSEAARWLAQKENYAELNDVALNSLQDKSVTVRSVLIDLAQTVTVKDSLRLGHAVLQALDDISTLHYQRVEQAPFVVLKAPDVPSILVETGFITNPREEKRLASLYYQNRIAYALQQGIAQYIKASPIPHSLVE